jgi:hypothetical protein
MGKKQGRRGELGKKRPTHAFIPSFNEMFPSPNKCFHLNHEEKRKSKRGKRESELECGGVCVSHSKDEVERIWKAYG